MHVVSQNCPLSRFEWIERISARSILEDLGLLAHDPMSESDAVDGSHPTASQCANLRMVLRDRDCRLVATSRGSQHLPAATELPPGADAQEGGAVGLLLLRVVGPLPLLDGVTYSGGRGPTSLKGGNRGGIRLRGAACWVYGDWGAAGWLPVVAWPCGSRGSGRPRQRRGGFATTLRCCRRVLLAELGARHGLEPSGAVAGGKGRHRARFSKG